MKNDTVFQDLLTGWSSPRKTIIGNKMGNTMILNTKTLKPMAENKAVDSAPTIYE